MAKTVQFSVPRQSNPQQTYSFPQGFAGGMNISVSADQIAPNQSPDMLNCSYDDGGVPTKRMGFARVTAASWGDTPIRGLHEYWRIGATEAIFLVAHGGKLYSYNEETGTKTNLCTGDVTSFNDGVISFFVAGDKCYFLTGNEFLYYDGENPVSTVQSIAKVPVVATATKPDGTGGIPNEAFNHLSQKWIRKYSPDGTSKDFVIPKFDDVTLSSNLFKAWVNGVEMTENAGFTVDRVNWKFSFPTPPVQGTDTIEIQIEATNLMDPTVISKCTRAIEFGGKNDSVVLVTGNPSFPNTIYYSWVYDPTYFPEDYDFNVGGDSRSISGWGRMNEYLVTYKEPGDDMLQWYSEIDLDTDGNISFSTYGLNDEFGCIAPRTVKPAQNGLLALSNKGVIWTWPSLVKGQANSKIVSQNINGRNGIARGLLDNDDSDLKSAHATVYGNKYMLRVKDTVWILDLDYSDLSQGICCWYPFDNIPGLASSFAERKSRLYFGTQNGVIYKERLRTDLFADQIYSEDSIEYGIANTFYDAYWTSPMLHVGGREWIKKFERLLSTFKPGELPTDVIMTLITDQEEESFIIPLEATFYDYNYVYYDRFSYGIETAVPFTQGEKLGYKGEYLQWRLRSGWDNPEFNFSYINFDYGRFGYGNPFYNGMTILSQILQYSNRKMVK